MKPRHAIGYVSTSILIGATGLLSVYEYATCEPTTQNLACLGASAEFKLWFIGVISIFLASLLLVALDDELSNYYGDQQ